MAKHHNIIAAGFAGLLIATPALAQMGGYRIETPGELSTQVRPDGNGGWYVQTPGELSTHIVPDQPQFVHPAPQQPMRPIQPLPCLSRFAC
jgi:hypothetical protein